MGKKIKQVIEDGKTLEEIGSINKTEAVFKKQKKELVDNLVSNKGKNTNKVKNKIKDKKTIEQIPQEIEKATEEETHKAVELLEKWTKKGKLNQNETDIMYMYLDKYGEQYLPNSISRPEIGNFIKWLCNMYSNLYYSAPDFASASSSDTTPTAENLRRYLSLCAILENVSFD